MNRLEVSRYAGPLAWRFQLRDEQGNKLAEHQVELDPAAWEFEAFTDLYGYLRRFAIPDRRLESEQQLVTAVGEWIAANALGPIADTLAATQRPVRLILPPEAAVLGYRPWELARVNGQPLAARRVGFVVEQQTPRPLTKKNVGQRLRMLAVFSLPEGAGALNLRKERFELAHMIHRIAQVNNKAIELRVLQYGATRKRLEEALLEQPGWDIVHLSGHGLAGALVLEDDAGRPDEIPSTELVDLLSYTNDQLKLVTLSACESAAVTAAEHLHLLGLGPAIRETADGQQNMSDAAPARPSLPALATHIVDQLDCAVLAMRYPVIDDFATELARSFYDLALGKGQPLPQALATSLPRTAGQQPRPAAPALSIGTPTLIGTRSANLVLEPPEGEPVVFTAERQKLSRFPPQPERFVGRVGPMTRATTALAPDSGRTGILFHGMAGAGKSACALELAYTHQDNFPLIAWHRAPDQDHDIKTALVDFAFSLEQQLPGLQLVHAVNDIAVLVQVLPSLTKAFEQNRVLIVVDNVESLLTERGMWRDERWGSLVAAMTGHRGLSRVVLTSRTSIAGLDPSVAVEAVHGLSLRESVLLARELPNLAALTDAQPPPAGVDAEQARELAARVLTVMQGHPKLIELADGQATDPTRLQQRLDDADRTWLDRGTHLEPFLAGNDPAPTDTAYLAVLQEWTRSAATTLNPDATLLLQMLCCTEDTDRIQPVLDGNWADLWRRLGRPGEPPDVGPLLTELAGRALLADTTEPDTGDVTGWRIHPGIADTIRSSTDPTITTAVDTELGDFWLATLQHALEGEQTGELGWLVLRAARCAAPYLLRQHRWPDLDHAAEQLLHRDESTATAAALLPMLDTALTTNPDDHKLALNLGRTHAQALIRLDPHQGAARLQDLLHTATTTHHWAHARILTGDLVNHHRRFGRLREALVLADTLPDYTRRAGHGPWSQLADQGSRLQILLLLGEHQQVLEQVLALREQMTALPDPPNPPDHTITTWNVHEALLQTGMYAARGLRHWQQALDLNAEVHASQQARGASPHEQASTRFNDYYPLLRSGHPAQARDLLITCRAVFETTNDINMLGQTLGALADAEDDLGHLSRAIGLQTDALRYTDLTGDPAAIATSHNNLAYYLHRDNHNPHLVWAHHLAAAIIHYQTSNGALTTSLHNLTQLLKTNPDTQPTTITDICTLLEKTDDVHLTQLLTQHTPDPQTAMTHLLHEASQITPEADTEQGG